MPPVQVDYRPLAPGSNNKNPESQAVNEDDNDQGVSNGPCPFTVHGLTGSELATLSMTSLKLKALQHLANDGKVLAVGHFDRPESLFNNPQLYPQMFPWLFPYGLGGLSNTNTISGVSEPMRK